MNNSNDYDYDYIVIGSGFGGSVSALTTIILVMQTDENYFKLDYKPSLFVAD